MTKPDRVNAHWFITTPEAILRAESILGAFHENRLDDLGQILAEDLVQGAEADPVSTLVAMIMMADTLGQVAGGATENTYRDMIRESARVCAEAIYTIRDGNHE